MRFKSINFISTVLFFPWYHIILTNGYISRLFEDKNDLSSAVFININWSILKIKNFL
jgi:hypothetical protein